MKFVTALLALLIASAPVLAEGTLHRVIQARENEWAAAFNQRDIPLLLEFFEPNAVVIGPGSPPAVGHKAISGMLAELGLRKGPIIRFLPRNHRVNVWLGQARHRLRQGRMASAA